MRTRSHRSDASPPVLPRRARATLAALGVVALALAVVVASFPPEHVERGVEAPLARVALPLASAAAGVLLLALAACRAPGRVAAGRAALASAGALLTWGALELPALAGVVDWRTLLSNPAGGFSASVKPWRNPWNRRDPELLYLRPAHGHVTGRTPGDCVLFLGVATDRTYPFDLRYDGRGFRNARELERATLAVIGDSFVESTLVPQERLHTTLLAADLGVDVANLGVSGYGPQQELAVLRRFALPLQPKLVLWVIFDGNDLQDLRRFDAMARDAAATDRDLNGFARRSLTENFLRRARRLLEAPQRQDDTAARRSSGRFNAPGPHAGTTLYFPYSHERRERDDEQALTQLCRLVESGRRACAEVGSRLAIVFAPEKFRVYGPHCDFPPDGWGRTWEPDALPRRLQEWCVERSLPFLDLTPALQAAAAAGELAYFVDDGHWNERGNAIVADALGAFVSELELMPRRADVQAGR